MILTLGVLYIFSILGGLILHELLHIFIAHLLSYSPKLTFLPPLKFQVYYENRYQPLDNLLISIISPLFLVFIGFFIELNIYTIILKITCLLNLFNLIPITGDGEVIFLSLMQMIKKKRGKRIET